MKYGHQLLDTIPLCLYDGQECASDDFDTFVDDALGNCFTFNFRPNVRHWTGRPGADRGLQLLLHSDQSEYLCVSQTSGFRIVVHKQGETPFPDTQGLSVPLGLVSSLAVTLTQVSKLPPPYGDCSESAEAFDEYIYKGNFSTEGCLRSCGQHVLTKQCQCADPRYRLPNGSRPCPPSEKPCLDFYHSCDKFGIAAMCKHCTMPCKRNFARLDVFYDRLNLMSFQETPDYEGSNLVSDVAGVLGIALGSSLITMLEFLLAAASIVAHALSRGRHSAVN